MSCASCLVRPGSRVHLMGVPLNDEVFSVMSEQEVAFWKSFLQEARDFLKQQYANGGCPPFDPPAFLTEKYWIAIEQYQGKKYCQVNQYELIFNFPSADVPSVSAVTG